MRWIWGKGGGGCEWERFLETRQIPLVAMLTDYFCIYMYMYIFFDVAWKPIISLGREGQKGRTKTIKNLAFTKEQPSLRAAMRAFWS